MKMLLKMLLIINLNTSIQGFAQVTDDFSDGNFTSQPAWSGDHSQFTISSSSAIPASMRPALKLNSESVDTSFLALESNYLESAEWSFWIKLSFNTSANNFARVYLASDQFNLKGPLNGYFIQIGGANDSISLYRQTGLQNQLLLTGNHAYTGNSTNILRIKVIHDESWEVFSDPGGGHNYISEGIAHDTSSYASSFFGIFCKYTSSNAKKIYFDEFYTGPRIIDSVPPEIKVVRVINDSILELIFNEAIQHESAADPENYIVDKGIGQALSAVHLPGEPEKVSLGFSGHFILGDTYLLSVKNIMDISGNMLEYQDFIFSHYVPQRYDVVINEIMADPVPAVYLPEYEYLELHNTRPFILNLKNWTLQLGSSQKIFPESEISPRGYLLVVKSDLIPYFSSFGDVVGFSSFSLPNAGQEIILSDSNNHLISYVNYQESWYDDPDKAEGGWSLEQINPMDPCVGEDNWKFSLHADGGTPGAKNSVFGSSNSNIMVTDICILSSTTIEIFLNHSMDSLSLANPVMFSADKNVGHPVETFPAQPDFNSVTLQFNENFMSGTIYTLTLENQLLDCQGNQIPEPVCFSFGIAGDPGFNDIVINELLFNPLGDGSDYVEIYNRSEKIFRLSDLNIASIKENPPNPSDTIIKPVATGCGQLLPNHYMVLTGNPEMVLKQYYTPERDAFVNIRSFPAYNNDAGCVLLTDKAHTIIDVFHYSEDMHFPLLNSFEGVSLERVHYNRPAQDPGNWHSASWSAGFGTPGYQNSQFVEEKMIDDPVEVDPAVFSPDGDGMNDVVSIRYHFSQPGNMASVVIYDSYGIKVKTLINNELIGTNGSWSWNGRNNAGEKLLAGLYIIYLEIFDLNGNTRHFKKVCVLAR